MLALSLVKLDNKKKSLVFGFKYTQIIQLFHEPPYSLYTKIKIKSRRYPWITIACVITTQLTPKNVISQTGMVKESFRMETRKLTL